MTYTIQTCSNFHWTRACIINTRLDEIEMKCVRLVHSRSQMSMFGSGSFLVFVSYQNSFQGLSLMSRHGSRGGIARVRVARSTLR